MASENPTTPLETQRPFGNPAMLGSPKQSGMIELDQDYPGEPEAFQLTVIHSAVALGGLNS